MALLDLSGRTFGRWQVLHRAESISVNGHTRSYWQCRCQCGTLKPVATTSLTRGASESCGCLKAEMAVKHGYAFKANRGGAKSKLYAIWTAMISRTDNPKHKNYHQYGGRGISVCERWKASFSAFLEDMGDRPSDKHSIDRIDTNGPYDPENCRWATSKEQSRNRRNTRNITWNGETRCLRDWSSELGFSKWVLEYRLRTGWSIDEAFSTPLGVRVGKRRTS